MASILPTCCGGDTADQQNKADKTMKMTFLPLRLPKKRSDHPEDENNEPVEFPLGDWEPMMEDETSSEEKKDKGTDPRRKKWCILFALLLLLLLGLILGIIYGLRGNQGRSSINKSEAGGRSAGDADDPVFGAPSSRRPFSTLHPVNDLGVRHVDRPVESSPDLDLFQYHPSRADGNRAALPTSNWYTNMLLPKGEPTTLHRVYSSPYVVDAAGPIPGIRLLPSWVNTNDNVMQLISTEGFGLTLGATVDLATNGQSSESKRYTVLQTTELGLSLGWTDAKMNTNIVRGMPYGTMYFDSVQTTSAGGKVTYPTIASEASLTSGLVDGSTSFDCSSSDSFRVDSEMELFFEESDYTWMVFVSEPVNVQCASNSLQIKDKVFAQDNGPIVVRIALLEDCTKGRNQNTCQIGRGKRVEGTPSIDVYRNLLRDYSNAYPGSRTTIGYSFTDDTSAAKLTFDWDAQRMVNFSGSTRMLMFALPHHFDLLDESLLPDGIRYCKSTMTGPTCLLEGTKWTMMETLPSVSFRAKRSPKPDFIPSIAEALLEDIDYSLPDFFTRGAGDTYFSGKMLGKLARIILIQEEIEELCQTPEYSGACEGVTLPSSTEFDAAIARLKSNVEVWFNGTAETEFIFDAEWGGMISCGCTWNGNGCSNRAPNCPSLTDQALNFGNGFYNDHHFHYGYHVYSAAVVAKYDPQWARDNFEKILLFVRSYANPSPDDYVFPVYRHKDWYQGSSWASGIHLPPYLNGKNQESSSEAIASYESVGLFGEIMYRIWKEDGNSQLAETSREIMNLGKLMAATEIRSTHWYWQVRKDDQEKQIYPQSYEHNVVGILWSTMAQFGTWFGNSPHFIYGIQLLPLTPIAEYRDDLSWINEMYYPLSQACYFSVECSTSGWAILQLAVLATVGYPEVALPRVQELNRDAFLTAGGNGQSKTNTLWYISTRPPVEDPVPLDNTDLPESNANRPSPPPAPLTDCLVPETCTDDVLDSDADGYSCRQRMLYLITQAGFTERDACSLVARDEHPDPCGPCDPDGSIEVNPPEREAELLECPPCTEQQCSNGLNECSSPFSFVCSSGARVGECSAASIWEVEDDSCTACCEITEACLSATSDAPTAVPTVESVPASSAPTSQPVDNGEGETDEISEAPTLQTGGGTGFGCPPCDDTVCLSLGKCSSNDPFVCTDGQAVGGCSSSPWVDSSGPTSVCSQCCDLTDCDTTLNGGSGGNEDPVDEEPVEEKPKQTCPLCDASICNSSLGQCQGTAPFVCTEGKAVGGCSSQPWQTPSPDCSSCCELACSDPTVDGIGEETPAASPTSEPEPEQSSDGCPVCDDSVCSSIRGHQCPGSAPFVCTEGNAVGGCSNQPWQTPSPDCSSCCELACSDPGNSEAGEETTVTSPVLEPEPEQSSSEGCPVCEDSVCNSYLAACPSLAPYVCVEGRASGGCSDMPWETSANPNADCSQCCELACT